MGKTPGHQVFVQPLIDLEQDEKEAFDKNNKGSRKRKSLKKRKPNTGEGDVVDLNEDDSDNEDFNAEANMFHSKTRVIQHSTPEALILSLYYGSKSLLIFLDEFLVSCV